MNDDLPSAAQIRAGRALLGWSQQQLSEACNTSRRTIAAFESGNSVSAESIMAMRDALAHEGVLFLGEGGDEGVRRSSSKQA